MSSRLLRPFIAVALLGLMALVPARVSLAQQRAVPGAVSALTPTPTAMPARTLSPARTAGVPIEEVEPNNLASEAQPLEGTSPLVVNGSAEVDDEGDIAFIDDQGEIIDDIEDLYVVTLEADGLSISLTGLAADCDLYVLNEQIDAVLEASALIGLDDEVIDAPTLPAGTYIVGISIFDPDPGPATESTYVLTVTGAVPTSVAAADDLPEGFALAQNYPNPFNPETTIRYEVPAPTAVRLAIYDLRGRLVRTLVAGEQAAGPHSIRWDGRNDAGAAVASGTYLYRLQADAVVTARTLVLLR